VICQIPGYGALELKTIILDLNGTLSVGGHIVDGVGPRLARLRDAGFKIVFFTGNTRNDADTIASTLGIEWELAASASQKAEAAQKYDPATCVSIGNGLIDLALTETVKLGIVTLQAEGVHTKTLMAADIVVPTIVDALDLLLDADRLIATLRS
jgi:soluble P-type ATPase